MSQINSQLQPRRESSEILDTLDSYLASSQELLGLEGAIQFIKPTDSSNKVVFAKISFLSDTPLPSGEFEKTEIYLRMPLNLATGGERARIEGYKRVVKEAIAIHQAGVAILRQGSSIEHEALSGLKEHEALRSFFKTDAYLKLDTGLFGRKVTLRRGHFEEGSYAMTRLNQQVKRSNSLWALLGSLFNRKWGKLQPLHLILDDKAPEIDQLATAIALRQAALLGDSRSQLQASANLTGAKSAEQEALLKQLESSQSAESRAILADLTTIEAPLKELSRRLTDLEKELKTISAALTGSSLPSSSKPTSAQLLLQLLTSIENEARYLQQVQTDLVDSAHQLLAAERNEKASKQLVEVDRKSAEEKLQKARTAYYTQLALLHYTIFSAPHSKQPENSTSINLLKQQSARRSLEAARAELLKTRNPLSLYSTQEKIDAAEALLGHCRAQHPFSQQLIELYSTLQSLSQNCEESEGISALATLGHEIAELWQELWRAAEKEVQVADLKGRCDKADSAVSALLQCAEEIQQQLASLQNIKKKSLDQEPYRQVEELMQHLFGRFSDLTGHLIELKVQS